MKRFITGAITGAVLASTVAFAASYIAEPATFKVIVNGNEFNSNPPALVVESRTYLPLRAMGDALGVPVEWNAELNQAEVGTTASAPTKEQHETVEVSTAKEFLENIKSNTTIILNEGVYNLSEVDKVDNKSVFKLEVFDGYEYNISSVSGLEIKAADNAEVTIVVEPRYANVLRFSNCEDITLSNIIAGHTVNQGDCTGGVIMLDKTTNTSIKDCKFYGCGTFGLIGYYGTDIQVSDTEIYECTYGAVDMTACKNAEFNSCIFRDCNGFSLFALSNCNDIHVADSGIKNNGNGTEFDSLISGSSSDDIVFSNCTFENNKYQEFTDDANIIFDNCRID